MKLVNFYSKNCLLCKRKFRTNLRCNCIILFAHFSEYNNHQKNGSLLFNTLQSLYLSTKIYLHVLIKFFINHTTLANFFLNLNGKQHFWKLRFKQNSKKLQLNSRFNIMVTLRYFLGENFSLERTQNDKSILIHFSNSAKIFINPENVLYVI